MGHKCYISFKTEDSAYKKHIQTDLTVDMIDKSLDEPIQSFDEDYILRKIREDYLADSTVTIHLIGRFSAENLGNNEQRFIKRELQASLYNSQTNPRSGILGVVLPEITANVYKGTYSCSTCGGNHNHVAINDSTTDALHYMKLTVAEGQRHTGVAGTGVLVDATDGWKTIGVWDPYTRVEWLEITNPTAGDWGVEVNVGSDNSTLSNLIILCPSHHRITDSIQAYSVERLRTIKLEHESRFDEQRFDLTDQQLQRLTSSPDVPRDSYELPGRNPFFTGRTGDLKRVRQTLMRSGSAAHTQPQVLCGLGGIGKTQIAVEYAHNFAAAYSPVIWVCAGSGGSLGM